MASLYLTFGKVPLVWQVCVESLVESQHVDMFVCIFLVRACGEEDG